MCANLTHTFKKGAIKMPNQDTSRRELQYYELLPQAYTAACILSNKRPSPATVGLVFNDLIDMRQPSSAAFRIAMSTRFTAKIVDVKKKTVNLTQNKTGEKFEISFTTAHDQEVQTITTPLLDDRNLGALTRKIWDHFDQNGRSELIGKRVLLYKHNNPPREGDKSQAGYRCCVFAKVQD